MKRLHLRGAANLQNHIICWLVTQLWLLGRPVHLHRKTTRHLGSAALVVAVVKLVVLVVVSVLPTTAQIRLK